MAGRNGTATATTLARILAPTLGYLSASAKVPAGCTGCWAQPLEQDSVVCLETAEVGLIRPSVSFYKIST